MRNPRSIDTDADQETIRRQKITPRIVEQCAIGLEGVFDSLPVRVTRLERHDSQEEVDREQRRFAKEGAISFGSGV